MSRQLTVFCSKVHRSLPSTFLGGMVAFVLVVFAGPGRLQAQSISPAVVQYRGASDGSFDVSNDTLTPLVVTLDTRSFTINPEGDGVFRPLDPDVHLELSQTSLKVPPRQRRTVYYKVSASQYPAWFTVYANFRGLPRRNGLNVQLSLPHTVYLLDGAGSPQHDLHFKNLSVKGDQVQGVLHNGGTAVLRVRELTAHCGKEKGTLGGFPLLPGGDRNFSMTLPHGSAPVMVRAQVDKFTLEQAVP